jgi:gliding motility-associated-like protein
MGLFGKNSLIVVFLILWNSIYAQQVSILVDAALNGQTTNTCSGFIIDSGGQGGAGYSNGENITFTVCPDNPDDIVNVQFNLFNLDPTDGNPNPNISDADKMMVYDGNSTAGTFLGEYNANGLQGVLVQCTPQNTSGCLTFRFVSNNVGNPGFFSASATCITPCDDPFAGGIVLAGISNDSIQGCLNEVFSFQDVDSYAQPGFTIAEYKWDFMDGNTAIGQNVTHSYTQPGHYRVQLFITDNNGCTNNNLIDIDVLVATKPSFINFQADTALCIGESLNLVATPLLYENTWLGFTGETTINNGCMTDQQLGVAQNVDIIQTGFSSGTTITDITQVQSLCLDMEHSFMGDLVVSISCPNGQSVLLHQQGGGGTQIGEPNPQDNVDCTDESTQGLPYSYCFTSGANLTWVGWANVNSGTIPAGDYLPIQSLGGLVGCPANGVWTLTVVDNWAADDGTVFSFELTLDPAMYPPVVEFTPEHGLNLDSSYWAFPAMFANNLSPDGDEMTLTPNQPGIYNYLYTVVNSFGCSNDTSFNLTVTDFTLPITIEDQTVCAGNLVSMIDDPNFNCEYTLRLQDSFGDGWNGNNLLLNLNGTTTSYTIPPNGSIANFQIPVSFGDQLILTFDGNGSFISECSYQVLNCDGTQIYNGVSPLSTLPNSIFISPFSIPVSYNWIPQSLFGNQVNLPNPQLFVPNNTTVGVNIYPVGHPLCAESIAFNISVVPNSYVGKDSTVSLCEQSQPLSLFPFLGFGANTNGTWSDPAGNPILMPVDPSVMLEGDYTYTVTNNNCVGVAIISVNKFSPSIDNLASIDANCTNSNNGSVTVTASNFTSYKVNNGPNLIATSPFTINNLGEGTYTITVVGAPGCVVSQDVFINDPDSLEIIFITPPSMICIGDSAQLTANGIGGSSNYIYNWSLNGVSVSNQQNITVKPANSFNTYCLTLSEQCGSINVTSCTDVLIEPNLLPLITTLKPNVCFGEEVILNDVTSGNVLSTLLTFGDGDSTLYLGSGQTFNHLYGELGPYSLTMTTISTNGCIYKNSFTNFVEVHKNPTANFFVTPDILLSNSPVVDFINQSSADVISSFWQIPGSLNSDSIYTFDAGANYPVGVAAEYPVTLTVVNSYNCIDSITKLILVQDDVIMYIPNSFTPNGDEFNNVWNVVISGIDVFNYSLTIFNRWGQIIFVSNDPTIGWDGTYGNTLVQAGIYQWRIEGVNQATGDEFSRFGFLNIFR